MKGKRESPPLSPSDTLSMLQSATSYCRKAGLILRFANHDQGLVLLVEGAQVTDDGNFVLTETKQAVPPAESVSPSQDNGGIATNRL